MLGFDDFSLPKPLLAALEKLNISKPTPDSGKDFFASFVGQGYYGNCPDRNRENAGLSSADTQRL